QGFKRPCQANILGPVAPCPKSAAFPLSGQKLHSASLKTRPKHASLEQRHTNPSFHQQNGSFIRKLIRKKSLETA
ncbi:hypothetical protein PO909_006496, partial [Leuciscus waleckii]